jgi:hypothetical protein
MPEQDQFRWSCRQFAGIAQFRSIRPDRLPKLFSPLIFHQQPCRQCSLAALRQVSDINLEGGKHLLCPQEFIKSWHRSKGGAAVACV